MALHQAWIHDSVVGSRNVDTAFRFLKHNGKDEARIDKAGLRDVGDCLLYPGSLLVGVISAPAVIATAVLDDIKVV